MIDIAKSFGEYAKNKRWFSGKARTIGAVERCAAIPLAIPSAKQAELVIVRVVYADDAPDETYALFAAQCPLDPALAADEIVAKNAETVAIDALSAKRCAAVGASLLELILTEDTVEAAEGTITATRYDAQRSSVTRDLPATLLDAGSSNSCLIYGAPKPQLLLKLQRRVVYGQNPELEMLQFLSAHDFPWAPPLLGALEYRTRENECATLGVLQGFEPSTGDAWEVATRQLRDYLTRAPSAAAQGNADDMLTAYLQRVAQLGQRTAALHRILISDPHNAAFAPEPFDRQHREALQDSILRQLSNLDLLATQLDALPPDTRRAAEALLKQRKQLETPLAGFVETEIDCSVSRHHGDFHLGQVMDTGDDYRIIDFEGEPRRTLQERRAKAPALRDVAGILRSFDYAASQVLHQFPHDQAAQLRPRAESWRDQASAAFLRAYLEALGDAPIRPKDPANLQRLLDLLILEKAAYELGYELNNRPDWVPTPIEALLTLAAK